MKNNHGEPPDRFDRLRRQAESLLVRPLENVPAPPPTDMMELIQELRIFQTELEIQNEELKRAHQEITDLHLEYMDLYEGAPWGYLTLNDKGMITRINRAGRRLLETDGKEVASQGFSRYVAPGWEDAYWAALKRSGITGEPQSLELKLAPEQGPGLWAQAEIQADRRDGKEVIQWRLSLMDVTAQKTAEAALGDVNANLERLVTERTALAEHRAAQLQKLAVELCRTEDQERRKLTATFHDGLQQQLADIKMKANIAAKEHDIRNDHAAGLELRHIADLVQESIDTCRRLSHELTPVELERDGLPAALLSLKDDFGKRYGLRIDMAVDSESGCRSSILSSILFRSIKELLHNIVKHSGSDSASLAVSLEGDQILLTVDDPGRGCDLAEVMSKKGAESGFGLFSIRDRMSLLGGNAAFSSAPGKGFSAALKIPAMIDSFPDAPGPMQPADARPPIAAPEIPEPGPRPPADRPVRILVADDHDPMRKYLVDILHEHGEFTVIGEVDNGIDAIRMAAERRPDIVLMDVSMPGMGGIKATEIICSMLSGVRVVGISMNTDAATRKGMTDAGACAFVSKADVFEELIDTIRSAAHSDGCGIRRT